MLSCNAKANIWQELADGFHFRTIHHKKNGQTIPLQVLKLDPKKVSIKPLHDSNGKTAREFVLSSQALAVVNANFFDTDGKILGLVKIDGKKIHSLKNISWWSVFCLQNNKASIYHQSQHKPGMCKQAIQAGPRLVVNGKIPKLKTKSSRKTAIGINLRGEVIIAVSGLAIPIQDLAQLFLKPEKQGGLGCLNAMNLDGGSSTQMYLKTDDYINSVASFIKVPVGLGVFKK